MKQPFFVVVGAAAAGATILASQALERRKSGEPNSFVVGRGSYQRFLDALSGCTEVQIARRTGA